jgi:hypothetical protein
MVVVCFRCHDALPQPGHSWCPACLSGTNTAVATQQGWAPTWVYPAGYAVKVCPRCGQIHIDWTITAAGGWRCGVCSWQSA